MVFGILRAPGRESLHGAQGFAIPWGGWGRALQSEQLAIVRLKIVRALWIELADDAQRLRIPCLVWHMSVHEAQGMRTLLVLDGPPKKCPAFFEQDIQRLLDSLNRILHGAYNLWSAPGTLTHEAPDVPRPMDNGSSICATATGLSRACRTGYGGLIHYKNIDVEHRTYTPQDSVKSQPCSLKTSLRWEERDEKGRGHLNAPYQKKHQGMSSMLILLYDETREQGI